jgi:hypothetical protein
MDSPDLVPLISYKEFLELQKNSLHKASRFFLLPPYSPARNLLLDKRIERGRCPRGWLVYDYGYEDTQAGFLRRFPWIARVFQDTRQSVRAYEKRRAQIVRRDAILKQNQATDGVILPEREKALASQSVLIVRASTERGW